jgi:hypothetical protein
MILFIYDYLVQLDTLAPIINFIQDKNKKTIILSTNPLHDYSKNNLVEYFKFRKINHISFIPSSYLNFFKFFLLKIVLFLPKKFLIRYEGFWHYLVNNKIFFSKKDFLNFLLKNNIKIITIPNDLPDYKKNFIKECQEYLNFKIVEIEVGVKTLDVKSYNRYPLNYCDYFIFSNKDFLKYNYSNIREIKKKGKFFGSARYTDKWIKILDNLKKKVIIKDKNIRCALFLNDRIKEENSKLLKEILANNSSILISNKPKSVLPLKCAEFSNDRFNANQLINWSNVIISYSTSVLIEAIKKKKKVIFCNFFKHDKKHKIVKSYFDSIKGFSRVNNIKKLINLINSLKKGDKVLYNNYDLSIVNRLRGFKNDKKLINDYKTFYNFLIKKNV